MQTCFTTVLSPQNSLKAFNCRRLFTDDYLFRRINIPVLPTFFPLHRLRLYETKEA